MRRAQQRRLAREQRRAELKRRRAGLAVSAAIGATALFAPAANAASLEVNSLLDGAPDACDTTPDGCTLRDAVEEADGNGEDDTITFQSGLSGTITLTEGQLVHDENNSLAINGPGAGALSVSAADASRIFYLGYQQGPYSSFDDDGGPVTITGLTLTQGSSSDDGGAILAVSPVTVVDSVVTGNAAGNGGGAIAGRRRVAVRNSTISGNVADGAGGGILSRGKYANMQVSDSTISGNSGGAGGGVRVDQAFKYLSAIAGEGPAKHAVRSSITGTTISGNDASYDGGGISFGLLGTGDEFTIANSTISGNDVVDEGVSAGHGGGIALSSKYEGPSASSLSAEVRASAHENYEDGLGPISGELTVSNTTISSNTAGAGGGVAAGGEDGGRVTGTEGRIAFDNSTIAANSASTSGGGIFLTRYETAYDNETETSTYGSPIVSLTSTIVGDNTVGGAAQDADRSDGSSSGGLDLSYSLVENAGDAPIAQTPTGTNLFGIDPQLGGLAANGGPTSTHLPTNVSPVVDQGKAPARLLTDQRGSARTVDGDAANAPAGDGTDMGAVEVGDPAADPPPLPQPLLPPALVGRDLLPIAVIKKNRLRRQKKTPFIKGVARDDDGVEEVRVALVNKVENRCRVMRPSGEFGKFKRCGRVRMFLPAEGTRRWRFELDKPLPIGYYVAYSRAYDVNGQPQMDFTPKSRRPFRIRP